MKIEIVTGAADNPVAEFFSSSSTPETDANEAWPASKLKLGNDSVVPSDFARRLERERDEWAALCGQYKQERDDAREMLQQYMFDRSGTWIDFLPADKPTP